MYNIKIQDVNNLRQKIKNLEGKEKQFFEDLIDYYESGLRNIDDYFDENPLFIAGVEKCGISYCTCEFLGGALQFYDTHNYYYVDTHEIANAIVNDSSRFKQYINSLNHINELYENKKYDIMLTDLG